MELVLGKLNDADSERFDVATDLLLADIVRLVIEKANTKRDGTAKSTR